MQRTMSQLIAAVFAAPLLFVASTASAGPSKAACGNIELAAAGECHFEYKGGCVSKCEPLNFRAACDGECNINIDTQCTTECSNACVQECTLKGGSFDCGVTCEAGCSGDCEASCASSKDKTACSAQCKGSCTASCDGGCEVKLPVETCETRCAKVCETSCETTANATCNYDCSAELTGGCETQCEKPEGGLFCDGQYVQVTNLDDCVAYIESQFSIDIEYEASAHGECSGNTCTGEAEANVSCAAAPVGGAPFDVGAIAAMATGVGLIVSRRRRRA